MRCRLYEAWTDFVVSRLDTRRPKVYGLWLKIHWIGWILMGRPKCDKTVVYDAS